MMESKLSSIQDEEKSKKSKKSSETSSESKEDYPGSDKLINWFSNIEKVNSGSISISLTDLKCNSLMKNDLIDAVECLNEEFTEEEECQLEAHYHIDPKLSESRVKDLALLIEKSEFLIKSWFKRRHVFDLLCRVDSSVNCSAGKQMVIDENSNITVLDEASSNFNSQYEDPIEVQKRSLLKTLFTINTYPTRDHIRGLSLAMYSSTWVIDDWFYKSRTMDRCKKDADESVGEKNDALRERFLPLPLSDRYFTWAEIDFLEIYIDINPKPSTAQFTEIADLLNTHYWKVEAWFDEHRYC